MKLWQILVAIIMILATLVGATAEVYYYDNFDSNTSCLKYWHCNVGNYTVLGSNLYIYYRDDVYRDGGCYLELPIPMSKDFRQNITLDQNFYVGGTNDYVRTVIPADTVPRGYYFNSSYNNYLRYSLDFYIGGGWSNEIGQWLGTDSLGKNYLIRNTINFDLLNGIQNITTYRSRYNDWFKAKFNSSSMQGFKDLLIQYKGSDSGMYIDWICLSDRKGECDGLTQPICAVCSENWVAYFTNLSCNSSDIMPEQKLYLDLNFCGTTDDLPIDNGTISTIYSCNYCSEDINEHFTSWGDCVLPEKLQERIRYYIDENFAGCCDVTGLSSDCNINNGSYINVSEQQSCEERYSSGDLASILSDGMGTAAASFVMNMDFFITLFALLGIVAIAALIVTKLRRH